MPCLRPCRETSCETARKAARSLRSPGERASVAASGVERMTRKPAANGKGPTHAPQPAWRQRRSATVRLRQGLPIFHASSKVKPKPLRSKMAGCQWNLVRVRVRVR